MMKIRLYSIKDKMVGFQKPFTMLSDASAVREFKNMVKYSQDPFVRQNYQDLELYFIGVMDEETGLLSADEQCPKLLQVGYTISVDLSSDEGAEEANG